MRGLAGTDVPVPDALALCEDDAVIGTPFFVMRWVPGRIFWDPTLPELTNDDRRALYAEYVRVLAALHRVDYVGGGLAGVDVKSLGIPTEDETVAEYCRLSGRGSIEGWPFFMAFGLFRLAAI